MKKAFARDGHWSPDGIRLAHGAQNLAREFLKNATRNGFSLRDAQLMLYSSIGYAAALLMVKKTAARDLKRMKAERGQKCPPRKKS